MPRLTGPFPDPRFRRLLAGQSLSTFGDTALYLTLLAGFALGSLTYLSDSLALVLAGTVADGAGLLWLVAVTGAAIQRYTPPAKNVSAETSVPASLSGRRSKAVR